MTTSLCLHVYEFLLFKNLVESKIKVVFIYIRRKRWKKKNMAQFLFQKGDAHAKKNNLNYDINDSQQNNLNPSLVNKAPSSLFVCSKLGFSH